MQTKINIFKIISNTNETQDSNTLVIQPVDPTLKLYAKPGQFNMLYAFGCGAIPISLSGINKNKNKYIHTIRSVGPASLALTKLKPNDEICLHGPYGTAWPLDLINNKHVLIMAGGVGIAPVKPLIDYFANNKTLALSTTILLGARSPQEILFYKQIRKVCYLDKNNFDIKITVDQADNTWTGHIGVITNLIPYVIKDPANTIVMICGPEIMMLYSCKSLLELNIPESQIYLSMERNMKCAIGLCGHCQYREYFICKDGPIFNYNQIKNLFYLREL